MIRVKNDIDFALSLLEAENKEKLKKFQSQQYFRPDRDKKKKPMKKKTASKPGGKQRR